MKLVSMLAQILLGLVFLLFGSNGFFHFLHMELPTGVAGFFIKALFASHFATLVSTFQVIGAVLLLINRFVPLGLTILGPILVNILAYHALLERGGLVFAIVIAILWGLAAWRCRQQFAGLFVQKVS